MQLDGAALGGLTPQQLTDRALHVTFGRGPKWVSGRIRRQEVARTLASANLRTTVGTTPGAYLRDLRDLVA